MGVGLVVMWSTQSIANTAQSSMFMYYVPVCACKRACVCVCAHLHVLLLVLLNIVSLRDTAKEFFTKLQPRIYLFIFIFMFTPSFWQPDLHS